MAGEQGLPGPIQPTEALSDIDRLVGVGVMRGLYPRWVAVLVGLWAGGCVTLFASSSSWLLPFVFLGFGAWWLWTRRTGAVYREVGSRRDVVIVMTTAFVFFGIMVCGLVMRREYGVAAAPWIAGAIVAYFLYLIMELSYAKVWAELGRTEAR